MIDVYGRLQQCALSFTWAALIFRENAMDEINVVSGAGQENRSLAKPRAEDLVLTHLGSLDLRGMRARVEQVDGDPVLFVDDGDVEIEFSSGMGGTWHEAVTGAERLAATAAAYAVELRRRGPVHPAVEASRTEPAT